MTYPPLTAPIDRSKDPPLHEMDWQRFERLTVDLVGYESNIATSDDYGVPGQTDHGVDVIARRQDGDGEEVASCKVKKDGAKAADLEGWSEDFLKHWDSVWSTHGIRRFVLALAAPNTGATDIQQQVTRERARFKKLGVTYEFWGPKQFVSKLRPQRALTARYLDDHWADIICGPTSDFGTRTGNSGAFIPAATVAQLADLQRRLSGQTAKRAEEALNDLRAGRLDKVRSVVSEFREETLWAQLEADVQAKILRLSASVAIRDGDLEKAEAFNFEAESLSPAEEPRIAAHLALEKVGVDAAIKALGAPISIAGKQLLSAFLISAGRVSELDGLLADLVELAGDDPETLRLSALYHLLKNDRAVALAEIRRAEAIAPDWSSIQLAGAFTRYAHSVSAVLTPDWLFFPNPVDAALVVSGAEVEQLLSEALLLLEHFDGLSGRREAQLWRLAILANQHNGLERASAYASTILAQSPDDATAIAWCLVRRLDVDLAPSGQALREGYETGSLDLYRTRVLGLLLTVTEAEDGATFLQSHLDAQPPGAREEAQRWIARLRGEEVSELGEPDDRIPDGLRYIQSTDDWSVMPGLLASAFAVDPPLPGAITAAQMTADFEKWELLTPWLDRLLAFGTIPAVRLAAFTASRSGDPSKTLSILEENQRLFSDGLPADLRRLRVDALARSGDIRSALHEADQIEARTQLIEDRLFKAELMVNIGDLRGTLPPVREALRSGKLSAFEALRWAQILQTVDRDLATELWRRAVSPDGELQKQFATAAMHQAFQLGLDDETAPLMPIVKERAKEQKEVRLVSLDEIQELLREQHEIAQGDQKLYLNGAIPTHLFVRGKTGSFLNIHLGAEPDYEGPLPARLIRSAARPRKLAFDVPWDEWKIHLDISGLLEAHELGLLDLLEFHPNSIRISPRLPLLLLQMEQAAIATQRSRLEAKKVVQKHIASRLIEPGSGASTAPTIVFPQDEDSEDVGLDALVRWMGTSGLLSSEDVQTRLQSLGMSDGVADQLEDFGDVTELHLDVGALEQAAGLDLLPILIKRFQITYPSAYEFQLRRELEAADHDSRLADSVGKLRERVAEGIKSGAYTTLPVANEVEDSDDDLLVSNLKDILAAPSIEHGMAWIDDRLVTSYSRSNTMPVVGVLDVLEHLVAAGTLTDVEFRGKLTQLRSTGAAFLPFETGEVADALFAAPILDGRVVETPELRAIRRNLASCARLERHLKLGNDDPLRAGRPDEFEYTRSSMRLLSDVLQEVWTRGGTTYEEDYARSNWLWSSARVTQTNREIPAADPLAAQDHLEVMQIGHCANIALDIGGLTDRRREARLQFLNWLWHRAIFPKLRADPTFLSRLVDYLTSFYSGLLNLDRTERPRDRRIMDKLLVARIQRLPDPLSEGLHKAPFMRRWGRTASIVTIGSIRFEAYRFWKAIRNARLYGKAKLRTFDGARVRVVHDGDSFKFSGRGKFRVTDGLFDVIGSRPADRPEAADRYLLTLDVPVDERARMRQAVAEAAEPANIAEILEDARSAAACARYARVDEKLRQSRSFGAEIFHPVGADQLLSYLAFTRESGPNLPVNEAFATLSERHGVREAFARLGGLPVSAVANGLRGLEEETLEALAAAACSPISLIHVAAASVGKRSDDAMVITLTRLIGAVERYGEAFTALLRWTERELIADATWRALPQGLKLALVWAHADRLMHLFIRRGADPEFLKTHFQENQRPVSAPDLIALRGLSNDAAAPQGCSTAVLLYHGLAAIFGERSVLEGVPDDLVERVKAVLVKATGEITAPDISILVRGPTSNAMGSFMSDEPVGLFPDSVSPHELRAKMVETALSVIETKGTDVTAGWAQLGAFGAKGMTEAQRVQFETLVKAADLWALGSADPQLEFHMWRTLLLPLLPEDRDWVSDQIGALAAKCFEVFGVRTEIGGELPNGPPTDALTELIEIASIVASTFDPDDQLREFSSLVASIAAGWPTAAGSLRVAVDNLLSFTPAGRAGPLWELHNLLQSCR